MIWVFQSFAGLFIDATVGQIVRALGGGGAPSSAWSPSWDEPARPADRFLPPAPLPPAPSFSNGGASWEPVAPAREAVAPAPEPGRDLEGDDVKLVRYSIVSLRRCHERLLQVDQEIVRGSMTIDGFAAWRIAVYMASRGREIPREDLRYLRVTYEILDRWPRRESSGCGDLRETEALREILATLRDWPRPGSAPAPGEPAKPSPAPEPPAPPAPAPAATVLAWDGTGTPSQVRGQGHLTLTRRWNGTCHDVTLEGTLSIRSRSFGHVRHALPPGFLPRETGPGIWPSAVQRHPALGDTSRLDNYGGPGVHIRRGDFPRYEGRATLWFPERTSGEFTLRCAWQTDEAAGPDTWQGHPGVRVLREGS